MTTSEDERLTLAEFLLARIHDDYRMGRGDVEEGSAVEIAARLRCNVRTLNIGFTGTLSGVPYEIDEAAKYATHPDYRQEWAP